MLFACQLKCSVPAEGRTPVHWAVLGGHAAVLDYLLSKGAYPDAFDSNDDSPLHLAARCAVAATCVCPRPSLVLQLCPMRGSGNDHLVWTAA